MQLLCVSMKKFSIYILESTLDDKQEFFYISSLVNSWLLFTNDSFGNRFELKTIWRPGKDFYFISVHCVQYTKLYFLNYFASRKFRFLNIYKYNSIN